MPNFQHLGCSIAQGGDRNMIIVRDATNPVTFPEFLILIAAHGEKSVFEIIDVTDVVDYDVVADRDEAAERAHLLKVYGEKRFRAVFPVDHMPLPKENPELAFAAARAAEAAAKDAAEKLKVAKEAAARKTKAKASEA